MLKRILSASILFTVGIGNAFAITDTWDFSTLTKDRNNLVGPELNMTSGAITLNGKGYADTTGGRDKYLEQGDLYLWGNGGLGLVNQDENRTDNPGHAFDNRNGDTDMLLLSFNTAVTLTGLDLAWGTDTDMSILAFGGTSFTGIEGLTWGTLGSDWIPQDNLQAAVSGGYQSINSNTASKYWLVGAYNSIFGRGDNLRGGNDAMKLAGIQTERSQFGGTTSVPEPSSILLMALAFLGLARSSYKKRS
ncbi:PEP-CTERM sorting domain-containing protein [Alginatibacterium sediminis]|uniref:PEP-CTERM sorting domain-containing protein n=1 Tax=Alginatibacterium sediminis TaxID=2164068 RepID=A0A420ED51_9ALTE|nr:exosortase-dependent surface protein XDP1 [Alginatibacterium sediminis]RKF18595.1 PEP-CTERM sorting domain-containing protein [Alginatibacterium sediminis]